ncbi:hypothetical protein [Foetidibacter luteolus]|uniref:hypothetical protein n=1 Tax=Foetidibacter luteolus TaxID=2608880 RepID=UPI00129ADAF3|nr:hypothetical protein [Foetidibacter luteolus]
MVHSINRQVSANVKKNINVYQGSPNFPLRSYGMPAVAEVVGTAIENIILTKRIMRGVTVSHSNIEMLMVNQVISWIIAAV